ncbi:MAG: hypothetical protein ACTHU0_15950 [Kofleriaceae bacterium]
MTRARATGPATLRPTARCIEQALAGIQLWGEPAQTVRTTLRLR